jgi:uncharacterized protein YcbK (DUF882 family)
MSAHFKRSEFVCPCCGANNISDEFIEKLEAVRQVYGKPMYINSGYRCPARNAAVGGVAESAHVEGLAADIGCTFATDRLKLVDLAISKGFRRIGVGKSFVHLDISTSLPQDVLWVYN